MARGTRSKRLPWFYLVGEGGREKASGDAGQGHCQASWPLLQRPAACAIARAEHHGSAHTCPTAGPSTTGGSTASTPPAAASSPPVFFDDNRMGSLLNPLTRDCRGRQSDGRGRVACHVRGRQSMWYTPRSRISPVRASTRRNKSGFGFGSLGTRAGKTDITVTKTISFG